MRIPMLLDAHVHPRVGEMMEAVLAVLLRYCAWFLAQPNNGPIKTGADARRYREELIAVASRHGHPDFDPGMTVMLTDRTDCHDVATWKAAGVKGAKYYPGALYPHGGVFDLRSQNNTDVLSAIVDDQIPWLGHLERKYDRNNMEIHPLVAEQAAIPDLCWVAENFPDLRTSVEHVSSRAMVEAIRGYPNVSATVTPQHLRLTADQVYDPARQQIRFAHNWCRPPAKTPEDREAIIDYAIIAGRYGSDLAPHPASSKTNIPLPAGCANYPAGPAVVAQVFAEHDALDILPAFTSGRTAAFYGVTIPTQTLTVCKERWTVPQFVHVGSQGEVIVPWLAGEELEWGVEPADPAA